MKTLHLYVLRQALATLVMTVCVFAFVLLIGNGLKEILALLVNRQATAFLILKAIALLIPWIMAYVLPFALLTGMLLLFGRLSADNELTAVRASGISLLALITPLLLLAILMSGVCAWVNMKVAPESRVAFKRLILQLTVQNSDMLITEDRFIDEIPGITLYVRKKNGDLLEDVRVYELDNGQVVKRTTAAKGQVIWDRERDTITLELTDASIELPYAREVEVREPAPIMNVTNLLGSNILTALATNPVVGRVIGKTSVPEWEYIQSGTVLSPPIELSKVNAPDRPQRLTEMTFAQLRAELRKRKNQGVSAMPVLVQMHRQVAFSFASFAFTLVAIPLGIRAHRRETSIGMGLSLILVLFYYGFFVMGEALQIREEISPQFIFWIPNLLFQGLGIFLLWRANRMG